MSTTLRRRWTKCATLSIAAVAAGTWGIAQQAHQQPGHQPSQETSQGEIRPIFDERFDLWPNPLKTEGRVIIHSGVKDLGPLEAFLTGLIKDNRVCSFAEEGDSMQVELSTLAKQATPVALGHGLPLLSEALEGAGTLYVAASAFEPATLAKFSAPLQAFVSRGGNLIFDADLGGMLGAVSASPQEGPTLGLMPDCLVDCTFDGTEGATAELTARIAKTPRTVGIGVEPGTLVVLGGRILTSLGSGSTTVVVPGNDAGPPVTRRLKATRRNRRGSRLDLTQWRRMAIDQSVEPFPPAKPRTPFVENGTLYIVGGGGMPEGLMSTMIEKAGGLKDARLVYIPCAESDEVDDRQRTVEMWKRMGVQHATFIHTKDRNKANTDEAILGPLRDATMLWFGGGRQWNFADSYYGTKAHELMKDVLHRGGVIGGSSAGASIQGRFLARATPIGNTSILAPGYERGGLGFLSGVAIDQHFSQRGRQKDMTQLVAKYPQLLGIGLDEATAIVVEKSRADVIGNGKVFFYDAGRKPESGESDYEALAAGASYDLADRKVLGH